MIEIYNFNDLHAPIGKVRFMEASITKDAGGVSELNFSVRAGVYKNIPRHAVFLAENMFFVPTQIQATDEVIGTWEISCGDLFNELIFRDLCKDSSYNFENVSLSYAMQKLVGLAPFSLSAVTSDYPLITGNYFEKTRQAAISDIKKQYGEFDIVVERLNIEVHRDFKRFPAIDIVKGRDCSVLDFSENFDNVVTHVRYRHEDETVLSTETSPYAHLYPFTRDRLVVLPDNNPLAFERMVSDVIERNKLPALNYRLEMTVPMYGRLNIFDIIKIKYEPFGIDIEQKVFSVSRKLGQSNTKDIVEIGIKEDDILDYIAQMSDGVSEINNKTSDENVQAHVENIINNYFEGDSFFNTMENVTKVIVLAAENIHAASAFITDAFVDRLWTNISDYLVKPNLVDTGERDSRNNPIMEFAQTRYTPTGKARRYSINIEGIGQKFVEQHLSVTEVVPFIVGGKQAWWTSIAGGPDPYKYLSYESPYSKYPEIDPENAEMFRVMITKTDAEYVKAHFSFSEITDSGGVTTLEPSLIFGTGNEDGHGKGYLNKRADGMYLTYTGRLNYNLPNSNEANRGVEMGVKITDEGVFYYDAEEKKWKLIGSGGSKAVLFPIDREPLKREDLKNVPINSVIHIYDSNEIIPWG